MKTVVLSIKPYYAGLIFDGDKVFEFRRKIWKDAQEGDRVLVYASSPTRLIIGEFKVGSIIEGGGNISLRNVTYGETGLTDAEFELYNPRFALEINEPRLYDGYTKSLADFGIKTPPQNFCYIKED